MSQGTSELEATTRSSPQHKYYAFISYRHADNTKEDQQWATWLHQQLEVYDVPAELIGTRNLRGEVIPARIYPVFRDEVSLPANADLTTAIAEALDQSQFLVVLCSPRAVQSTYVAQEIAHFKATGKADRVMAALLLGEPNASVDGSKIEDPEDVRTLECFPRALQYAVSESRELLLDKLSHPIAADFRLPDGGKGITNPNVFKQQLLQAGETRGRAEKMAVAYEEKINNARLKIIAGILGVQLETLTKRDKVHQLKKARAQAKRAWRVGSAMALLFVGAVVAAAVAWMQYQEAEMQTEVAAAVSDFLADDLLATVAPSSQRGRGRDVLMKEVLDVASSRLDGRFAEAPAVEISLRLTLSRTYRYLGDYASAEVHALRALALSKQALGPREITTASAMYGLGALRFRQGRFDDAESMLSGYLEFDDLLSESELASGLDLLASVYRRMDRYEEALDRQTLAIEKSVSANGRKSVETLRFISNLATIYQETGNPAKAIELRAGCSDWIELLGPNSLEEVSCLNNLANEYSLVDDNTNSEEIMRRAYAVKLALYGEDHPLTLNSLHNLAVLALMTERIDDAVEQFGNVLARRTEVLGQQHQRTIWSAIDFAEALILNENLPIAEQILQQYLPIARDTLGENHYDTLRATGLWGLLECRQGKLASAEATLRRLLDQYSVENLRDRDLEGELQAFLGIVLFDLGQEQESKRLLAQADDYLASYQRSWLRKHQYLVEDGVEAGETE